MVRSSGTTLKLPLDRKKSNFRGIGIKLFRTRVIMYIRFEFSLEDSFSVSSLDSDSPWLW